MRSVVAALLLTLSACHLMTGASDTHTDVRVSEVRYVMGTLLDITLYAPSEREGRATLNETFAIAEHLDDVLSTWKSESAVSVFNAKETTAPQPVSPELYELVKEGKKLSKQTAEAFSITVRPLITLWHSAQKQNRPPLPHEIKTLLPILTSDSVSLGEHGTIAKQHPLAAVETGGIGKGYAVDKMLAYLRDRGIKSAFINFGRSSMGCVGSPPNTSGWPVKLELTLGSIAGRLMLRDETLTVSRAHGTPIVIDGKLYAHIFDPATGLPIEASQGAAVRTAQATDGEALVKYLVIRGVPTQNILANWPELEWMVQQDASTHVSDGFKLLDDNGSNS